MKVEESCGSWILGSSGYFFIVEDRVQEGRFARVRSPNEQEFLGLDKLSFVVLNLGSQEGGQSVIVDLMSIRFCDFERSLIIGLHYVSDTYLLPYERS